MTQTRILQTLKERLDAGERPAVDVGGQPYEFAGVLWGGVSPLVWLRDSSGAQTSKTAAAWSREGASFRARSRNLARTASKTSEKKTAAQLEREIKEVQSIVGEGLIVIAWLENEMEIAPGQKTSWRHDLGERPKLVSVKKPRVAVWINRGTESDAKSALAYVRKQYPETGSVLVYPATEQDPLGRARADILVGRGRR